MPIRTKTGAEGLAAPLETRGWHYLVVLVSIASVVLVHIPAIVNRTILQLDEAYAASLAERLVEGYKLYDGAVSQRGPLMYYSFEAFAKIAGWDNLLALRIWGLLLALAHLLVVYWAARVLLSKTAALIAIAISGYAFSFGFAPDDGMAVNGESIQMPAVLAACVLGALAMKRLPASKDRLWILVVTGLMFGAAIAIKPSVALHPCAVVLLIAVDAHRRSAGRVGPAVRAFFIDSGVLFAAVLAVPLVLVLHAAHEGTLGQLYYYCITYNRDVHLRPRTDFLFWIPALTYYIRDCPLFVLTICLLAGTALPYVGRRLRAFWRTKSIGTLAHGFGVRQYIAIHLGLGLISASTMYRFFPHYYLQAWPFLALSVGMMLERPFRSAARPLTIRVLAGGFLAFTATMALFEWNVISGSRGRVSHDETVITVASIIEKGTAADDRVFVWGFAPWIYTYAHRRPAGRYVFSTYVTGLVPWYWDSLAVEKARIVPGSTEALLSDLDREKPEIVVDGGSVMMGRSMRAYEKPCAWLHANYCFELRVGAFDLYRRKQPETACAVDYFPRVHSAVDSRGKPLENIPVARTLDYATSPALPHANFWRPLYFPNSPVPRGVDGQLERRIDEDRDKAADGLEIFDLR